jgi:cyclopropane-fatty-acyl-phospholipid synthase
MILALSVLPEYILCNWHHAVNERIALARVQGKLLWELLSMFSLLQNALDRMVKTGNLIVTDAGGQDHRFGDETGKLIHVQITDQSLYPKLAINPDLHAGEAYMNGTLVMKTGEIYDLLQLVASQIDYGYPESWNLVDRLRYYWRTIASFNPIHRACKNVAHHYDLSGSFYDLFLDRDRQYSCAYFEHPKQSLEDAQLAKKRHIAAKLALEPGMRVLDIGSGWGGLALYLAEICDVDVIGVTLSEEQHKLSCQRVKNRRLEERVDIRLKDYRLLDEKFDRIVSVGMFEHVGLTHFGEFFGQVQTLLNHDGAALIHTIGRPHGPAATSKWIQKYIFPGGYIPSLSEMQPAIERSGLYVSDVEVLRLHYAETLKAWRKRFLNHRDKAAAIYDERFCRMWEFYLAASEMSFRQEGLNVFQVQMASHQDVLPITRDYMIDAENRLRNSDQKSRAPKSVSS